MKNIVGAPARGEDFFPRKREVEKIVERLEAGNNLQITAPRRVGKTSILHYLKDNSTGGYIYIYVDTEHVDNEQDFYRKLLKTIVKTDSIAQSRRLTSLFEQGVRFLKKIKSVKVAGTGIDFSEDEKTDYYEELTNFLSGFEHESGHKLVLLIDEFPQTILNIVAEYDDKAAIKFLQSNRELRMNPDLAGKVQYIFTGSIGLNHTVASISGSAFVNDLNSTEVEPLQADEATELIHELVQEKNINIDEPSSDYLLGKINWLIPFHIQLAVQEIADIVRESKTVTPVTIDEAFERMITNKNQNHFDHYSSRLKSQFKDKDYQYASAILDIAAAKGTIGSGELYDQAVGYDVQDSYRQIVDILAYDGYINNNGDRHVYQFNSPIVRMWWQKFICK